MSIWLNQISRPPWRGGIWNSQLNGGGGNTLNVTTLNYTGVAITLAEEPRPQGIALSPDKTRMYVVGIQTNQIHQYSLSTPGDPRTRTHIRSVSLGAFDLNQGLFIKPDGTQFWVNDAGSSRILQEFLLSTPWEMNTLSVGVSYSWSGDFTTTGTPFVRADGGMFFLASDANDVLNRYDMGTPFNISTAPATPTQSKSLNFISKAYWFNPEGTRAIANFSDGTIKEIDLSAWDLDTAVTNGNSFSDLQGETSMRDMHVDDEFENLYFVGDSLDQLLWFTMNQAA